MDLKKIFDKKFFLFLATILGVELLSYLGFVWPIINTIGFFALAAAVLILSLQDLKLGLLVVLAELFIGSMGYLFFLETGGVTISIRIALWLIVMAVWLGKAIMRIIKRDVIASLQHDNKRWWHDFKLPYAKYFYGLFAFVALGLVVGYFSGNKLSNIFYDVNNWFYLVLIFPLAHAFKTKNDWQKLLQVFVAAILWLAVETAVLLFFFSHYPDWAGLPNQYKTQGMGIYRWLRMSGVGEITAMGFGFVRVFFQSYLYLLFGVCLLLPFVIKLIKDKDVIASRPNDNRGLWLSWWLLTAGLTVILIGQSRSFWVGLAAALVIFAINYFLKKRDSIAPARLALQNIAGRSLQNDRGKWRAWFKFIGFFAASVIASLLLMTTLVKLPGLGVWNALSQKGNLGEAAVSSRWALLPKLWQKIGESPILGSGFGTTVVYQSSDPRVLETHPDGLYETYAFEWGWLDLWLKLSLLGVAIYLWFLFVLARDAWRLQSELGTGLVLIITALVVINTFSPYLNHPLGLSAIMLIATILKSSRNDT